MTEEVDNNIENIFKAIITRYGDKRKVEFDKKVIEIVLKISIF